jgi:hypothetical protein
MEFEAINAVSERLPDPSLSGRSPRPAHRQPPAPCAVARPIPFDEPLMTAVLALS